ncbi:MAG: sulfatase [Kiritimatiellales bacterium]
MNFQKPLFTAVTTLCLASGSVRAAPQRPNILFLAVDDLNDWIGCYTNGYPGTVHTPNMDRLASEGLLFQKAYCSVALCNPSRTAILTGRYAFMSGVYGNNTCFRDYDGLKDLVTLPQLFKNNGYTTVNAGKIFHHNSGKMADPVSWDVVTDLPSGTPNPENENPLDIHFPAKYHEKAFRYGALSQPKEACGDYRQARFCADFLKEKHDKPFFLAYGSIRPHMPLFAPKEYFDLYPLDQIVLPDVPADDYDDIPEKAKYYKTFDVHEIITKADAWKYYVQAYLACVSLADDCLGQVLNALEASPYRDNTIVVFWGDNGFHLGEKQHWGKFTLWEPADRVPLIMKVPGITTPGTETDSVVSLMDLYPTLVSLAGLSLPAGVEGRNLTPVLRHPETEWSDPVITTWFPGNHTLRTPRYRYIRYEDGSEELYDMEKDPNEFTNLAGNPERAALIREMRTHLPETNHPDVEKSK